MQSTIICTRQGSSSSIDGRSDCELCVINRLRALEDIQPPPREKLALRFAIIESLQADFQVYGGVRPRQAGQALVERFDIEPFPYFSAK